LFDDVSFDDKLREQADKEGIFKSSDLKFYLLTFAFVGVGALIMIKFSKK
jgi:hypothetical protein